MNKNRMLHGELQPPTKLNIQQENSQADRQ